MANCYQEMIELSDIHYCENTFILYDKGIKGYNHGSKKIISVNNIIDMAFDDIGGRGVAIIVIKRNVNEKFIYSVHGISKDEFEILRKFIFNYHQI